jgi:hypothetical protein
MSLAACSNSEEYAQLSEPVELQVTAGIGNGAKTRTDANYDNWTEGTSIVLTDANGGTSGAHETSYSYTLSSGNGTAYGKFTSTSGFVFDPSETDVTLAAFTYNDATTPSISKDDSGNKSVALTTTTGSLPDLLYSYKSGLSPKSPSVNFEFSHALTKLTIKIAFETGLTQSNASASLYNYYTSASVAIGASDITVTGTKAGTSDSQTISLETSGSTFILAPGAQTLKVKVTNDSKDYYANITNTLEKGKAYECTLTLKKSDLVVGTGGSTDTSSADNACVIVSWDANTTAITGDALMSNQ